MRVLITGSDGFIGRHLKSALERCGHHVTGTVFFKRPHASEVYLDLCGDISNNGLSEKSFDALVHTAGIVDQNAPKSLIYAVNALGTRRILELARRMGCGHFIQLSSVSVYGLRVMGENRTEDRTPRYMGRWTIPYARSKAHAEEFVEKSGVPYTILRMPAVIGRGDSFVGQSIIPPLRDGSFFLCGRGDRLFSMLNVRNLASVVHALLERGALMSAFNCADHHVCWREFAGEYARQLGLDFNPGKRSVLSIPYRYGDKGYLFLMSASRFGLHYPAEKLMSLIDCDGFLPWPEAVKDSIQGFIEREASNNGAPKGNV